MSNKKIIQVCPICNSVCSVEGDDIEGTHYYVPLSTTDQLDTLKKENFDLKMNQFSKNDLDLIKRHLDQAHNNYFEPKNENLTRIINKIDSILKKD